MKYMLHPKNISGLAKEIIKACDDYWAKNSSEEEIKEAFEIWKIRIINEDGEIKNSIKNIIGKKRIYVLEECIKSIN